MVASIVAHRVTNLLPGIVLMLGWRGVTSDLMGLPKRKEADGDAMKVIGFEEHYKLPAIFDAHHDAGASTLDLLKRRAT